MKINDLIYGFKINRATEISDIGATLFEACHLKSGARLLFLEREDENKTFSITFKTIPDDSTGVFHIIEHAVLCGSRKYRTKEPFVDLLKGSLNTFLNAMTFPDKTMYPVASRNDKDFQNLVSVYLDAVFHPAILENENIFKQEGWHYEWDEEKGELSTSGVVLNEMRGAFSSPDELATYHINEMLYPDTCYRFESGGEPQHITELRYDKFCAEHRKYYHPSNAEIFLDGTVNLDEILPLIDSYLSEYEKREITFKIPDQPPISPIKREITYEISDTETKENKTRLALGYLANRFDEQEISIALAVMMDAVASANESPLKKAIIDSGLCEDMDIIPLDSIKQNSITVDFKNVKDGKADELYSLFVDEIKKLADCGIDKTALTASMNSLEFKMRERDYGTTPTGIIYAMSTLESSLYGGDPAQNLSYEKSFLSIREKIKTDYFEKLLLSTFVENSHRATLIMIPSETLGEERVKKEREKMKKIKDSLSPCELENIIKSEKELKAWQEKPDSAEDIMTIPRLKISDISADTERIPEISEEKDGVVFLNHPLATAGIIYCDLAFDVSDLTPDEITKARILISLLENLPTEKHSALELQNSIKSELGSFSASLSPISKKGETKIHLIVSASALETKKEAIIELTEEILYTTVYKNKEPVRNVLRQLKMASEDSFTSSGHLSALRRACAYINAESVVQEYYSGYEAHIAIKSLEKNLDLEFDGLCKNLTELSKKIFTRERLTVSTTGKRDKEFENELIKAIRCGSSPSPVRHILPFGVRREGIVIPAQAAYSALAENVYALGSEITGSLNVAKAILSYGYLWQQIRVGGGAYGAGFVARNNGNIGFYSYRDPSPHKSIDTYKKAGEYLQNFAENGEDISNFIIGAIGDASPLTTPKLKGTLATMRYLRGVSYEDECRIRRQMLKTDEKELLRIAELLCEATKKDAICVVGSRDKLAECKLDSLLEI